ncbi:MAG: hypothetical protein Q6370_012340 [Candidatus Sigynarchaeota archaeon]
MPFNDILFDAKKLVKLIGPAAWGQGFESGRGAGISLARVIECMEDAQVQPGPREGYVQEPPIAILHSLALLTKRDRPLCKNGAEIRAKLADVVEENTRNFSRGEKILLKTLEDLPDDDQKLRFYLVFQEDLDRLLLLAGRR